MADNIAITAGSGTSVSTNDESAAHVQRVHGTNETVVIQVTPTVTASGIYAAKESIGGLLTFANAVRWSGGSGTIRAVILRDLDQELAAMDLCLFNASVTVAGDNSAFDPTDAELLTAIATIPISGGNYADFTDNAVAAISDLNIPFRVAATSMYGVLVARSTPTYTGTSDISVTLVIVQD